MVVAAERSTKDFVKGLKQRGQELKRRKNELIKLSGELYKSLSDLMLDVEGNVGVFNLPDQFGKQEDGSLIVVEKQVAHFKLIISKKDSESIGLNVFEKDVRGFYMGKGKHREITPETIREVNEKITMKTL